MPSKDIEDPMPKDLFDMLACPLCRSSLEYSKGKISLLCANCGAEYPIRKGIPDFTPAKSQKLRQ